MVQVQYRTKLKWNWKPYNRIVLGARLGAIQAANEYKTVLVAKMSVPGFGIPSAPGTPPHMQTGNLVTSVKTSFTLLKDVQRARISSRVRYAPELEHGKPSIGLLARPVWLPTFLLMHRRMITVIIKTARKNT